MKMETCAACFIGKHEECSTINCPCPCPLKDADVKQDMVNHPPHYKALGFEVIDITEKFNFNLGNALKYIMRADFKGNTVEDLKKAAWYVNREIERLNNADS